MENKEKNQERKKKKRVGAYILSYETKFDMRKSLTITLTLKSNQRFAELLQEIVVDDEETECTYGVQHLTRFKAKSWVYRQLNYRGRNALFLKDLINNKKAEIKYHSIDILEDEVENIRKAFHDLVKLAKQYQNLTKEPEEENDY